MKDLANIVQDEIHQKSCRIARKEREKLLKVAINK